MISWAKVYNDQRINTHYILMALQTRKKKAAYLYQLSFYVSLCMPSRHCTQSFQIQDHLEPPQKMFILSRLIGMYE